MNLQESHSFSLAEFLAEVPLDNQYKLAQRNYLIYCYGPNKTFGECYVALITNYFGLNWDQRVDAVLRLSIYLRAYTIVDDDLRDDPDGNQTFFRILRQYFLSMACMEVDKMCAHDIDAIQCLQIELERYDQAADLYCELHSRVNSLPRDFCYTQKYADRMAMVRVPFQILGRLCKNDQVLKHGVRGIERFMQALQLLDDVVDWEEDVRQRRITYPVFSYLATLPRTQRDDTVECIFTRGPEHVEEKIRLISQDAPYSHILRKQLKQAEHVLATAKRDFSKGVGSEFSLKTGDVSERLGQVLSEVDPNLPAPDLVSRLKCSGVAPVRSGLERGFDGS